MNKDSDLDCYLFFMWNEWCKDICLAIFGKLMGEHIWGKWCHLCEEYRSVGAPAAIYSELDAEKRRAIVERAIKHYNK